MVDAHNQSDSIIIGNCLDCQGLVRVPLKTSASSRVRCPHCGEEYFLSHILDQAVPALEVVGYELEPVIPHVDKVLLKTDSGDGDQPQKFVVPTQLSKGAKRTRRRRGPQGSLSGKDVLASNSDKKRKSRSSDGRRSQSRNSNRRSRGKKSDVFEVVKIVLGGVLAIPIAYLLVFWLFHRDPLNVGPGISRIVPFAVPIEFHEKRIDAPAGNDTPDGEATP